MSDLKKISFNSSPLEQGYRNLSTNEIEILRKNGNYAENWQNIFVKDEFLPELVKNCEFYGQITLGKLQNIYLEKNGLKLPVGLYNSMIISCNIGDNVVIKNVSVLSHYNIDNNSILFNIGEMLTTPNAKFGNSIIQEGEREEKRIWIEICNENSGRKILIFEDLIPADAYLWSRFRDDEKLMKILIEITDREYKDKIGGYGYVGKGCVIKHCKIIKDVKIGDYAYIKGVNKLKNLTILSSYEEPSLIGEGVELINGIIGYGSKIFYGSKAINFVTGNNTQLKYGVRIINTVLGDNSEISCGEVLNNLIFPFHNQHHNNSFLIASTILGQSNIAAGATIGSNHNSRSNDGEIIAGRGFWPGLCTSFKFNSKFASFVLVAKGSYNYELNILYPFSLIKCDGSEEPVKIIPAYWFIYNMYAIIRNSYKFLERDKRILKIQKIETDFLAPDSVSEILDALSRLYLLIGKKIGGNNLNNENYIKIGKEYFLAKKEEIELLDMEAMNRHGGIVLYPIRGINEYIKMCKYFVFKTIESSFHLESNKRISLEQFINELNKVYFEYKLYKRWFNMGGQLIPEEEILRIIEDIKTGKINTWAKIHEEYEKLWLEYPSLKLRFALYVLEELIGKPLTLLNHEDWETLLAEINLLADEIYEKAFSSRAKDYSSFFRKITFRNEREMISVLGDINENSFLKKLHSEITGFKLFYQKILSKTS